MPIADAFRQVAEIPVQPVLPRSNKNPYDKSTIVSIFPSRLEEYKYTIQPSKFVIEPGTFENPSVTVIGPSSWFKELDNQPAIEVTCSSVEVAESIIRDYCVGMLGCDMEGKIPGLFFIPGEVSLKEIKAKYTTKLEEVRQKQINWFHELVRIADALWTRNPNPINIWDQMKLAARELGLTNKPWVSDDIAVTKKKCFACGNLRDPQFPVCQTCRAIDPEHPLAKQIQFAG